MSKPLKMSQIADYADVPDFLEHYGVKGMRWGVRKERGRSSRSEKKQDDREPNKTIDINIGPRHHSKVSKMSDAELRQRIERLQLEQRLKDLESGKPAQTVAKGKSFSQRLMEEAGSTAMKIAVTAVATAATAAAMKAVTGRASKVKVPPPPKKSPWGPPKS